MSYLNFIMVLLSLILPSAALVAMSKRRFEEVLPLVISLIVTSLYLFGALGFLRLGFYTIIVVTLVLFTTAYFRIKRDVMLFIRNFFSPNLLIYVLCSFLIFLLVNDHFFQSHDVFSHWGLTAKNTFILDSFAIGPDANTTFQDYPPATSLFQYWLLRVAGDYSEALVTYSMSLWGFALLIPLFKKIRWGDYKLILLATTFCLVFPLILLWGNKHTFSYIFYTLATVDFLMGLLFGYLVFSIISLRNCKSPFELLTLILTLFTLVLIKKVGVVLAIIAIAIGLTDMLITGKRLGFSGDKHIALIKICFFLLSPVIIAFYSWDAVLELYDASRVAMNNAHSGILTKIIAGDSGIFPAHAAEVFSTYVNALYKKPLTGGAVQLSFVALTLLLSTGIFILYCYQDDNLTRRRIVYASIILLSSACIYLVGHMLMYLTILSHGESVELSSFRRYLSPLLLGVMYVLSGFLIHSAVKSNNFTSRFALLLLVSTAIISLNPKSFDTVVYKKIIASRLAYEEAISPIAKLLLEHRSAGQVCFLEPEASESFYSIALSLNYLSAPVRLNRFIMYSIADESSRDWHIYRYNKHLLNECSTVLSFFDRYANASNVDAYYNTPFIEDVKLLGLYSVVKTPDDKVSLSLLDCTLCGRSDIFTSVEEILNKKAKIR